MFGNNDNQQSTVGAPTTQSPSMLDNVSAQDFTGTKPAAQPATTTPATPQPAEPATDHPITSDNPFNPAPAAQKSSYTPNADVTAPTAPAVTPATSTPAPTPSVAPVSEPVKSSGPPQISTHSKPTIQPSGPVNPPSAATPDPATTAAPSQTVATNDDTDDSSVPSVDTTKLAEMKQQALDHLEPLVNHLDQKPEEQFKTTMMMIQANDNHTLLDQALVAAKAITDDKERAQAMLDIINEINYFSQSKSE